jgi:hypothetical protein
VNARSRTAGGPQGTQPGGASPLTAAVGLAAEACLQGGAPVFEGDETGNVVFRAMRRLPYATAKVTTPSAS